jgi:hypothetical protein
MGEPGAGVGESRQWEIIKSIVYGGLIESITSLSVVSSAAGAGAANCKCHFFIPKFNSIVQISFLNKFNLVLSPFELICNIFNVVLFLYGKRNLCNQSVSEVCEHKLPFNKLYFMSHISFVISPFEFSRNKYLISNGNL